MARGSFSRALSAVLAACAVSAALMLSPASAQAGDADSWWDAYNGPYDVITHPVNVRAGVYSRQALMDNLWRYRYAGANENFVWYSDVVRIAANSGYYWASRSWSSGCWQDSAGYYFNRCDTGFWYPSDTFTTWYYNGTFIARMCGNHTPSISSPQPPRMAGKIWHDYNANGVIDAGEPGLSSWSVYLNRESSRAFTGDANVNGDFNIAIDAVAGMTPNAGYYVGPASVPAGWVVTKWPDGAWVPEGPSSVGVTHGGRNIGVRQIIPPVTSVIASPPAPTGNAGWYRTPLTFTFSVNEPATTRYSIDATAPVTVWSSGSVSVAEGTHVVRYYSVDGVGDTESTKQTTFKVDVTRPSSPDATWSATSLNSARISWTPATDNISGVAGYKVIDLDSSAVLATTTAGATSAEIGGLDPRTTYRIAVLAVDVAGNESFPGIPAVFAIDNIKPVSTLHASPAAPDGLNGWYVSNPGVRVTANETATCYLGIDGPEQTTSTTETLSEGVHDLTYHSEDSAGNVEDSRSASIKVDVTAPELSIAPLTKYFDTASVSVAATDSMSGLALVEYRIDGGEWTEGASVEVTGYGSHTLEARAADVAGNATDVARRDLQIAYSDTLPPVTTAAGDIDNWVRTVATVALSAEDFARLGEIVSGVDHTECYVDGAPSDSNALSFDRDGVYAIDFLSTDRAGNVEATKSATVKVDTTPPTTTTSATATYSSVASFTLNAQDSLSGVSATYYSLDGGGWKSGTAISTSAEGMHTLRYYSTDVAENVEATQTVKFTVIYPRPPGDTTPPVTTLEGVDGWTRHPVVATLTAVDDFSGVDRTLYIISDGVETIYGHPLNFNDEGVTPLKYWSVDKAGNPEDPHSAEIKIDRTPPTVPGAPVWTVLTPESVVLSWAPSTDLLSGVDHYIVYDGAKEVTSTGDCRIELSVSPGSQHSYSIRAVDVAGNESDLSSSLTVDVPEDGGSGHVDPGESVVTTVLVPVYDHNRDRDQHQNGDGDAVMAAATVAIANVTQPGTLTVTWSENPPKKADAEFMFANEYYDVSFTGSFDGKVTITLPYDPRWPDAKAENFSLKHLVNGSWQDVPVTVDLVNHTVTGIVDSLSPFAHALPVSMDLSTRLISGRWTTPFVGSSVRLSTRLVDASSTPLPDFTVVLERFRDGGWSFVTTATAVAGSPGSYSARTTPARTGTTRYRFRFAPDLFDGSVGPEIKVLTKARLIGSARVRARKATFTVGVAPGHGVVSLVIERKSGSTFKRAAAVKVRTPRGHGIYAVKLRPGTYRYRLIHTDTTHAKSTSSWKTLRVR